MAQNASSYRALGAKWLQENQAKEPAPKDGVTFEQGATTAGSMLGTVVGAYFANPVAGAAIGRAAGGLVGGAVDPDDPSLTAEERIKNLVPDVVTGASAMKSDSTTDTPTDTPTDAAEGAAFAAKSAARIRDMYRNKKATGGF